jgi:hypothetical protein
MRSSYNLIFFYLLTILFTACDLKDNKSVDPKANFVKVYDNEGFGRAYLPIDVKQTADGGYIVLAKTRLEDSQFYGIYSMKADAEGNFVSSQVLDNNFVNPVGNLMPVGSDFYFFCMNGITLNAKLMKMDANAQITEVSELDVIYPLASAPDGTSGFLLYHYNRDELESVLTKVGINGAKTASKNYSVGVGEFNVEEPIIDHLTGTRTPIPFLCGNAGGRYYFNGFYNYTLSLVFFSFSDDEETEPGVLQGYRDERGISSALHLSGTQFAISRFGFGQNFLLPQVTLNPASGATDSSSDLGGNPFPQLISNAPISLQKMNLNNQNVLLYASTTQDKQMALFAYSESGGTLLGSKYLGFSNPYEMGNVAKTTDGGLIVVGTTYVAGRFPRICLYKLDMEDLKGLIGQ